MLENLHQYRLVLASNSPRRKELLAGLGLPFEVRPVPDADESFPDGLKGADVAAHIALSKAEAGRTSMASDELLVTADTIVCLDDVVFGKPVDREDALRMLRALSGRKHVVHTGVCLQAAAFRTSFVVSTDVHFADLTEEEMTHYVDGYAPFDKAGAYGVQEWIGFVAVEGISGSYYNVMGLPVHRLYEEFKRFPSLSGPHRP